MTIMKKITLLLVLAALITGTSMAQKTRFGIQAGPVMSDMTFSVGGDNISTDQKIGFTAGLMLDKQIGKAVAFQTGLNYVSKGYKIEYYNNSEGEIMLDYLEIPLNFLYRASPEKGFFAGAGPSLGYALGGKSKTGGEKDDLDFGGEEGLKRFEFGGNLVAGYLFGKLQVALNYNLGLSNILPDVASDDSKLKNNYFGLRVGYFFK
jgi:hypothetical protein